MDIKVCVRCGSDFTKPRDEHMARWSLRRYCSIVCYREREPAPLAERFWRYVAKGDGCWEWQAARLPNGYGTFCPDRDHVMPAHRFSWVLHFGPIPPGLYVCHHCDNPPCVRPDHLFVGTAFDNNLDMTRKGRRRTGSLPGVSNPNARLTEVQVREIRRRRADGETTIALGAEFGVSGPLISYIALRKAWKHVA